MSTCLSKQIDITNSYPKPARLISPTSPQKNSRQIALEPPQKQFDDESHIKATQQPLQPNYSEYPLKQLRDECRQRGIVPTGDLRRRESWVQALG